MARLRRTYIAQLEGMALLSPYLTYPDRLVGRRVVHFVDNTVALSAMVNGYSSSTDMAALANAFHLTAVGLGARTYFDYVPSKANIADLPSRGEYDVPRRLGAVQGRPMVLPTRQQLEGPLHAWLDEALAAAAAVMAAAE